MSYDLYLRDQVTKETLCVPGHLMTGGNIPCVFENGQFHQVPSTEAYLNITYNYAPYYYEAFPETEDEAGDTDRSDDIKRFGIVSKRGGIRSIEGLTGAEAIPLLREMIRRIKGKYRDGNGNWIKTEHTKNRVRNRRTGKVGGVEDKLSAYFDFKHGGMSDEDAGKEVDELYESFTEKITVDEGSVGESYWDATAVNAIRPLYQLIALSELRPDGVWSEES